MIVTVLEWVNGGLKETTFLQSNNICYVRLQQRFSRSNNGDGEAAAYEKSPAVMGPGFERQ